NGRYNNLAPGSYYPDAPHIFLSDAEFLVLWQGPERVFLFVPAEHRGAAAQRLPSRGTYLIAESGGKAFMKISRQHPRLDERTDICAINVVKFRRMKIC